MRIAIAQIGALVGAFEENLEKIEKFYERACADEARFLVTPELSVCGYPLYDLVLRSETIERNEKALAYLIKKTVGKKTALIVGHVASGDCRYGPGFKNSVSVLENGKQVFTQSKTLLPTYDVFDEARYFEPASGVHLWNCSGVLVAIGICEDFWANASFPSKSLYSSDPVQIYRQQNAQLILSIASSPFQLGKGKQREALHWEVAHKLGTPLVYVNQVGATDEILFDGGSFAIDGEGQSVLRFPYFQSGMAFIELNGIHLGKCNSFLDFSPLKKIPSDIELLNQALILGIKEYFIKTQFKKAFIGLSGGIDSAVVCILAVQALGKENVIAVAMPGPYSSSESLEDAQILTKNLDIALEVYPIDSLFSLAWGKISEKKGILTPLALENLQSRLRGMVLMALANNESALVLATGNKSELAMGYGTLYGDMIGALAPIGDLFKTKVYELAAYLNKIPHWEKKIPKRILTKPPSAELRPNQKDQDTLPPYEDLDPLLSDYIEKGFSKQMIESHYSKKNLGNIADLLERFECNEYKRHQIPPILKVSAKAFGIGRRVPIAKFWDRSLKRGS